jgi:hydroxymethylglutaryl-CoA lyase
VLEALEKSMDELVKIVECPRDAWQALRAQIAPDVKAAYLQKLIDAGFTHVDAVSFVSPAAVPQMADSEKVLGLLEIPEHVEIIGIVVNVKGAERAIKTGAVKTLGFPYSISPTFLERNQHQTQEESLRELGEIKSMAREVGLNVVAYLSMAFGNPYGDEWSVKGVRDACDAMIALGIGQVSLADTVGLAAPALIAEVLRHVFQSHGDIEIGAHLHARSVDAAEKIRAAYDAGCRRFDAAMGGLGGCPFAQDALVGNIPTEILIAELKELNAQLPKLRQLDELIGASAEIAGKFGAATVED